MLQNPLLFWYRSWWHRSGGRGSRVSGVVWCLLVPAVSAQAEDPIEMSHPVPVTVRAVMTWATGLRLDNAPTTDRLSSRFERSRTLYQRGMPAEALRELTPLIALSPSPESCFLRGQIRMAQAQYSFALEDFDACAGTRTDGPELRYLRGVTLLHLGRPEEAIGDFDRVIGVRSESFDAFRNRAFGHYLLRNYAKAADDYAECIRIRPADAASYRNRALALLHAQNFADAIDCLNVHIGYIPDDAESYFNRGMAYLRLRKWDRAITDLRRFTRLRPDDGNAWFQLSLCYMSRADREWERADDARAAPDYAEAVATLNEATRRRRSDPAAFFNLAQACIKLARVTEDEEPYRTAETALETFLALAPDDRDVPAVRAQLEQIRQRRGGRAAGITAPITPPPDGSADSGPHNARMPR
ncbi:MAG: tetratricopeptide repeat protein [Capsulimonadales bacterium]|nr:tetratricopeptide repeat protein [Capsulimonadales bacterium]